MAQATELHLLFGIFGFIVSLFGMLGNSLALPAFSFHGRLSGTEVYLLGMVITDIIFLILTMLLRLGPYISSEYGTQVKYYSRFSVHLIPWLGPFEDMARVASTWLVLGLLFDRFIYIRYGMAGKESYSRKRVSLILSFLMLCLGAYQLPRIFEFTLICNHEVSDKHGPMTGMLVIRSWMGSQSTYLNLIYSHLRIPINYTMPIIFSCVFFFLICVRLPTRKDVAKSEKSPSTFLAAGDPQMIPLTADAVQVDTEVQWRRKLIYMRERRFTELSLFLGAVLIFQLVFYLLYDCLRLESSLPPWKPNALLSDQFKVWELVARVIDFLFPALRPIAYAFTCHEYMRELRDIFCCRKSEASQFYSVDYKEARSYEELVQLPPLNQEERAANSLQEEK
ncbi:hypothetical protein Ciccas_004756 [Cichlidogyrus casuarinus]|uniref:G-protein coupled receptors family 1 profile domain-containing protein n=1 Tax=Cichlidogyrus casuarinus TaxID=1844966 RepID=A0ABD2QAK3_9PLAT